MIEFVKDNMKTQVTACVYNNHNIVHAGYKTFPIAKDNTVHKNTTKSLLRKIGLNTISIVSNNIPPRNFNIHILKNQSISFKVKLSVLNSLTSL